MDNENGGAGLGIASLVLSLVGLFLFGIILEPLALVFGIISIKSGNKTCKSLGMAGTIVSSIMLGIMLLGFVFLASLVK